MPLKIFVPRTKMNNIQYKKYVEYCDENDAIPLPQKQRWREHWKRMKSHD